MTKTNRYPVVLFIYKRPESTLEILQRITDSGVSKVYIFADGPKVAQDKKITDLVQKIVRDFVVTHPGIHFSLNFSKGNWGLKHSIISGLNAVFQKEKAAIIIEDDCIPSGDFFIFCSTMLTKYRTNKKVMSISGYSVGRESDYSYDFAKYQLCWGWATWSRSWEKYSKSIKAGDVSKMTKINNLSLISRWCWRTILRIVDAKIIDTWDYQWSFTHLLNKGLAIIPTQNLVSNIGFDSNSTNTHYYAKKYRKACESLELPIVHPTRVMENSQLSLAIEKQFYTTHISLLGAVYYLAKLTFKKSK